jgi:hypothetical protein
VREISPATALRLSSPTLHSRSEQIWSGRCRPPYSQNIFLVLNSVLMRMQAEVPCWFKTCCWSRARSQRRGASGRRCVLDEIRLLRWVDMNLARQRASPGAKIFRERRILFVFSTDDGEGVKVVRHRARHSQPMSSEKNRSSRLRALRQPTPAATITKRTAELLHIEAEAIAFHCID